MELVNYVRKPFIVEAIEITTENIEEIAPMVGTLHTEGDQPYIQVDRKLVPNVYKVYPGFWLTKLGNNVRCYSSHIFKAQFVEITPSIDELLQHLKDEEKTE